MAWPICRYPLAKKSVEVLKHAMNPNLRRLRRKASYDTILSVAESNVVAGTLLGLSHLLLFGSGVQRFNGSSGPRTQLLQETVPAGQIDQRTLLQGGGSHPVSTEGTPEGNVGSGEGVSGYERAQEAVGIETLEDRVECLEVQSIERAQLREPFVLLVQRVPLDTL